ncbi:MAG: hypothetical protein KAT05_11580 [Spirochaetes bacterium]|nr:hypothetical protein [Spirochaetota bacterium]
MKIGGFILACISFLLLSACATVDVTKTGKGYTPPTDANNIEIIMTKPDFNYTELAAITAAKHPPSQTAKMHNSLRAKSAPLGATHVLLLNQGIDPGGLLWATGVAIKKE